MRNGYWTVLLLAAAGVAACAGSASKAVKPAADSLTAESLAGKWVRSGASGAAKGVVLGADGSLGLVGYPERAGVRWRLEAGRLTITTNSPQDPAVAELTLPIAVHAANQATIGGDPAYAGEWRRDAAAIGTVTGTAAYRQRIAMPPDAVLEVQLADVSRADAPAEVLSRQVIVLAGRQVPVAFSLPYAVEEIVPSHTYAVSARLTAGGKLRFITTQRYAVITRDAPIAIDLQLEPVAGAPPGVAVTAKAPATFAVPGRFVGTLNCAGCDTRAHDLRLAADGTFVLRRESGGGEVEWTTGRWLYSDTPGELALQVANTLQRFTVVGADQLRPADAPADQSGGTTAPLRRTTEPAPPTGPLMLGGVYHADGDTAHFMDCGLRKRWPVAAGTAAAKQLARAGRGGRPVAVTIVASGVDGTGPLQVEQVVELLDQPTCPERLVDDALVNTYWKLVWVNGQAVGMAGGRREPHFVLQLDTDRLRGQAPCNAFSGSYHVDGAALTIGRLAATRMSCPGMAVETSLLQVLQGTRRYAIHANSLELWDDSRLLARFESRLMR